MASRSRAGSGQDGRDEPGGQWTARSIFIAAALITVAWLLALLLLAIWVIELIV
jgi:hypothetical protein